MEKDAKRSTFARQQTKKKIDPRRASLLLFRSQKTRTVEIDSSNTEAMKNAQALNRNYGAKIKIVSPSTKKSD